MGIIYKITNKVTNQVYIGQTSKTLNQRWEQHKKEAKEALDGIRQSFPLFHRMIIKYGENNFTPEILEECQNSELDIKEKYWINYYDSYNNGYNSTIGGQKKIKEKINHGAAVIQYTLEGQFLKIFNTVQEAADEVRIHPSNIRKCCNGNTKSSGGFKWEWQQGLKKEEKTIEIARKNNKKVFQYDMKGNLIAEYDNVKTAADSVGISKTGIYNCCLGKQKTSGGYLWTYKI